MGNYKIILHYCENFKPTKNVEETRFAEKCNEVHHFLGDVDSFEVVEDKPDEIKEVTPILKNLGEVIEKKNKTPLNYFGLIFKGLNNFKIKNESSLLCNYVDLCEQINSFEHEMMEIKNSMEEIEKPCFDKVYKFYTEALMGPIEHNIILEYLIGLFKDPTQQSRQSFENYKYEYERFVKAQTNPSYSRLQIARKNFMQKKHFYLREELNLILVGGYIKEKKNIINQNPRREHLKRELKELENEEAELINFLTKTETFKNKFCIQLFECLYDKDLPNYLFNQFMGLDMDFKVDEGSRHAILDFLVSFKDKFQHRSLKDEDSDIMEKMNQLQDASEIGDQDRLINLRSEIIRDCSERGFYISKEKLCFSEEEEERFEQLINILVEKEEIYHQYVRKWKSKKTTKLFNDHNRELMQRNWGINKNLKEEAWRRKVFLTLDKFECEEKIEKYEFFVKEFHKYFGLSAVGTVIGGETPEFVESDPTRFLKKEEKDLLKFRNELNVGLNDNMKFMEVLKAGIAITLENNEFPKFDTPNFVFGETYSDKVRKKQVDIRTIKIQSNIEYRAKIEPLKKNLMELEKKKVELESKKDIILSLFEISESNKSKRTNSMDWQVVEKKPIFIKGRRKIENEYRLNNHNKKIQDEIVKNRIGEIFEKASLQNNRYFVISDAETLEETAENCKEYFSKKSTTPFIFKDFSRYRKFSEEKRMFKEENKSGEEVSKIEEQFLNAKINSKFDQLYNSNANKKYDIQGTCNFIKLMSAMAILNIKPVSSDYSLFGLKKCQAKYALNNFKKVIIQLLQNIDKTSPC